MAASEVTISSNSQASTGSEADLFTAITAAGAYQLFIDTSVLVGGAVPDIVELRLYMTPHAGGTNRQVGNTITFVGGVAPKIWWSPAVMSPNSYKWTIRRQQGTDRTYVYAVYKA